MKPEISPEATDALRGLTWQRGLLSLAVCLAFVLTAILVGRLIRRRFSDQTDWGGPVFALSKLLTYFLAAVGVATALSLLGVPLSSLLLTSTALLVGVGFSLQHVARDFIAGIILLVEQPIRRNDFITFGETAGTVREIGLRATHLLTRDGTDLVVPNHLLVTTEVANHSHPHERSRLTVEVPVSLRQDVRLAEKTLSAVAGRNPKVLREPPPLVRLDAILDSGFQFALIVWVSDPRMAPRIASELRFAIACAFSQDGIEFPTPELRLHNQPLGAETEGAAEIQGESSGTEQPHH